MRGDATVAAKTAAASSNYVAFAARFDRWNGRNAARRLPAAALRWIELRSQQRSTYFRQTLDLNLSCRTIINKNKIN
jgi:hypothetical protein